MKKLPSTVAVQAWIDLNRVQRYLLDEISTSLKSSELPPLEWYDVLLELHRTGSSGLRQYEIAERVLLSKHNLSRLLDRLEQQGLVERVNCEEDGRGNRVCITTTGETIRQQVWPTYANCLQTLVADKLTADECQALSLLLRKLRDSPAT